LKSGIDIDNDNDNDNDNDTTIVEELMVNEITGTLK